MQSGVPHMEVLINKMGVMLEVPQCLNDMT
jgi:hypothetical protein